MGKEEIEKDAREVIGSADRKNHKPSFSDKVDQEFEARKKAQDEKGAAFDPAPQEDESSAQPSSGGAGGPELDENGEPVVPVPEPGPLTEQDLNKSPEEYLDDEATEGMAEKPDLEVVKDMGADKGTGNPDADVANETGKGGEFKPESRPLQEDPSVDADSVDDTGKGPEVERQKPKA